MILTHLERKRRMSYVSTLRTQALDYHRAAVLEVKAAQEAYEAARDEERKLAEFLVRLDAHNDPTPVQEALLDEVSLPLAVPHTIDVGAVARALPKRNPFTHLPDSLSSWMWELMQEGGPWRVKKDLIPELRTATGLTYGESTIDNVLKRESTIFETHPSGGWCVTAAYRSPQKVADATSA
jgi:hypothetical protein